ncbi:hypothetical protein [Okeania sp. KiyG1]|uniref:hypothetical protein n=1 Tax=Okeania sp. KiyG1 TaxID=2720165 RepID=UPI001F1EF959|nr:hypothetical protein [Okeania sp. KiyG1]
MAIRPYILIILLKIVAIVVIKCLKLYQLELPNCPKCQTVLDRDENAAINILNKALNEVGIILTACGGLGVSQPVFRSATYNAQRCASTRKKLLCLRSSRYNLRFNGRELHDRDY